MPKVPEIDDLISQGARMQESLHRIRDVVIAQQVAIAEQAHDHREMTSNGYAGEESSQYQGEAKASSGGGFAGADAKKRRGVSGIYNCV